LISFALTSRAINSSLPTTYALLVVTLASVPRELG